MNFERVVNDMIDDDMKDMTTQVFNTKNKSKIIIKIKSKRILYYVYTQETPFSKPHYNKKVSSTSADKTSFNRIPTPRMTLKFKAETMKFIYVPEIIAKIETQPIRLCAPQLLNLVNRKLASNYGLRRFTQHLRD